MGSVRTVGLVDKKSGTVLLESIANRLSCLILVHAYFIISSQELSLFHMFAIFSSVYMFISFISIIPFYLIANYFEPTVDD
jgi:hypothetical protein